MPSLKQFDPPADINDFPAGSPEDTAFRKEWNASLDRMTRQTIQNLPWAYNNQGHLTEYYDPLTTDIPSTAVIAPIKWIAFPNRILQLFPNASQQEQWKYADNRPPDINHQPYTPEGARGWQDEYCEWSVTRNAQGKITKVMFTCENREYWFSLWRADPNVVVQLYQQLVSSHVKESDLYLLDRNNQPVIDRETGRPAYNDLNKWNNTTTQGAVHLVSNPNALSAEILIAGQATIPRDDHGQPVTSGNALLACGPFGQPNRNSDPHISASVNALVREPNNLRVSLHNPVGLYIQEPDFGTYQLPFAADPNDNPADFWTIVRGRKRTSPNSIDEILHAVYEVPQDKGYVVGDISIAGFPIEFGSQITQTFQIALAGYGFPISGAKPKAQICVSEKTVADPQPQQLIDLNLATASSRDPLVPRIEQGTTVDNLVLFTSGADRNSTITIGTDIKVSVDHFNASPEYFIVTLTVDPTAELGDHSVLLTHSNGAAGPPAEGLLEVVPAGSLNAAAPTVRQLASAEDCHEDTHLPQSGPHNKSRY